MTTAAKMTRRELTPADRDAFTELAERHRRELQLHCYRMLGSLHDAEDAVQEALLRAWRGRASFEGRSTFRAWLYGIATRASLDAIARRGRRPTAQGEVPWLEPCPDDLLEGATGAEAGPEAALLARETVELAYVAALQHLPARGRAALILRDVLEWPARDAAEALGVSVAAVNSALQRARATLRERLPERRAEWPSGVDPTRAERALLARYVDATESGDWRALLDLLAEDARWTMPPEPGVWVGRERMVQAWIDGLDPVEHRDFRALVVRANAQPGVAIYLRRPGDDVYRPFTLDALRIEEGVISELVTFTSRVFPAFGLPATL